ncbi:MAG: hypothetical protein JJT87_19255 [Halomonas sp.]|nr:hypothetical protein [Halomonas sp.]MCC5904054.1 hypothetical protein [Halomonas sp.]
MKFVVRQMLAVPREQRKAAFNQWAKVFTHITPEKVKGVWDQVVDEIKRNAKGNKTQQLRNNATKTQQRGK